MAETAVMRARLPWIDHARGTAVIAMVLYHFSWNLAHFGFIPPASMATPLGVWSARLIAGSFLLLAGISLALAHQNGFRAGAFWRRLVWLALAAAAVSAVSMISMPGLPIYFGILHCIAVSSLIGLVFLRVPPVITAIVGAGIVALPLTGWTHAGGFWLIWLGLGGVPQAMADYVPLIPFSGVLLLGVAIGGLMRPTASTGTPAAMSVLGKGLSTLGRYSLIIYLLHQPLLFGLTSVAAGILAPNRTTGDGSFVTNCIAECVGVGAAENRCNSLCTCTFQRLGNRAPTASTLEKDLSERANRAAIQACLRENPN